MISFFVNERGATQRRFDIDANEVTIGRIEGNDVVLPKANVSKQHAKIVRDDERTTIFDLGSTNGTLVNGKRISEPTVLTASDEVKIGESTLTLVPPEEPQRSSGRAPGRPTPLYGEAPIPSAPPAHPPEAAIRAGATRLGPPDAEEPPSRAPAPPAPATDAPQPPPLPDASEAAQPPTTDRLRAALTAVMRRLSDSIDVRQPRERELGGEERTALRATIDRLLGDGAIGPEIDRRFVADAAEQEAVGLGPLGPLLATGRLREVVVQGATSIYADMGGGLTPVAGFFSSTEALVTTARRLLARAGRELGSDPAQRVRLPGGIQLDVLMPPLVRNAPVVSLRCPAASLESPDFLLTEGWLSDAIRDLLRRSMQARVNVLVSGAAGAGVSTLLSGLALLSAPNTRFVTIERTPSLRLGKLSPVTLDRVEPTQGRLAPLLTHARLLRPDHLVLDDIDGEDALSLLREASCLRGVLAGMHAPSVGDALEWLEAHASLALGTRDTLAPLLARSFRLAVHVGLDDDGAHRVMDVAEIRGAREGALDAALLYRYDGGFRATGTRPSFLPA